jgi:hypothetical protein
MRIKAGYKTSEFWFTFVSFIFSGLYLTGILKENEHKEELITIVSHAVESIILISGQIWILARYIRGRNEVKKIAEAEILKAEPKNHGKKQRVNQTRSRKTNSKNQRKTPRS